MPFQEIRHKENCLIFRLYDKEGYILIPSLYRKYFGENVKILFDPKNNLLALQPSKSEEDYHSVRWRIWCTPFLKEYRILEQKVEVTWDAGKGYLIGKVIR